MARDLEDLYAVYNRRYFRNRLPVIEVRWASTEPGHAAEFCTGKDGSYWINIHPLIKRCKLNNYVSLLLLHEMSHVKLRNTRCADHGPKWQAEMKRLAKIGAFNHLW